MEFITPHSFMNEVFIAAIALFPVVNPIGSAFILSPYFENLSKREKRSAVVRIVFYAFCICIFALFFGQWVLSLFGLSIPVVKLAGGIMICKLGWDFLSAEKKPSMDHAELEEDVSVSAYTHLKDKLFYPITFPATTGAGTISVIFTLSAHKEAFGSQAYYSHTLAIFIAVLIMCAMIYVFYFNTRTIIKYMGQGGENVINRISAFLIFCVGLQIGLTGLKEIF